MQKVLLVATGLVMVGVSGQALALGGLIGRTADTIGAVVAAPSDTLKNLATALPFTLNSTATGVGYLVQAVPGIIGGDTVKSTTTAIPLPLPGPGLLNANLATVPNVLSADIASGGGMYTITISTGP